MELIFSFLISVMAGMVANYISKWLDRDFPAMSLRSKPPYKNGIEKPRDATLGFSLLIWKHISHSFA